MPPLATVTTGVRNLNTLENESQACQDSMITAPRHVISSPKIEYRYLRIDGDPLKCVTFVHNFETCLEKLMPIIPESCNC